jgi:hypothetical protein
MPQRAIGKPAIRIQLRVTKLFTRQTFATVKRFTQRASTDLAEPALSLQRRCRNPRMGKHPDDAVAAHVDLANVRVTDHAFVQAMHGEAIACGFADSLGQQTRSE